jgi:hypothetical protein
MSGAETWRAFVLELATQPALIEAVTGAHVPTADGLCRACTTPGYGTPQKRWPCPLWRLADDARTARRRLVEKRPSQRAP